MKFAPIRTEKELDAALVRVEALMERDVDPRTPEGDELEVLSLLIQAYEDKHYPIELPPPVDAIRFRMDQAGLSQQDLVPYIGSRSKVSEVLSGRRQLSLNMIRRLHAGLGIPLECLIQDVEDDAMVGNNPGDLRAGARRARKAGDIRAARLLEAAADA